jgi:hypothetical protein
VESAGYRQLKKSMIGWNVRAARFAASQTLARTISLGLYVVV